MAASKAELWGQLAKAVKIEDEFFKFCNANTPNFLGMVDTLQQSYEGDHIGNTQAALAAMHSSLNTLAGQTTRLQYLILELAKRGYNSRATTAALALDDIAAGMDASSETIVKRNWTRGSVTAGGSNVGTGTVYRVKTDKYGNAIEVGAVAGGIIKLECVSDKNAGRTSGAEQFSIYGSGVVPIDNINYGTAPAGSDTLTAVRSTDGKLANASFESYDGTGGTDITFDSWALTSSTDAEVDTTNYYRLGAGTAVGTALEFTGNNSIVQQVASFQGALDLTKPVLLIARYYRKTCDGALTLRLGSKTVAVADLTAVADETWIDLVIGATANEGWYEEFLEDSGGDGFRVSVTLASNTTGSLLIDDIIFAQPTAYDGTYFFITAGRTDFLKGDYFTFTDSVSNTGEIQTHIARLFSKSLPHAASSSETYSDAT